MGSNFATKPDQSLLEVTYHLSCLLLWLIRWSSRVTAPRRAESKRPGGAEHAGSDSEHRQVRVIKNTAHIERKLKTKCDLFSFSLF